MTEKQVTVTTQKLLQLLYSDSDIPRIRASIPSHHSAHALTASGSERLLNSARIVAATAMEALAELPLTEIETEADCLRIAAAIVPTDGVPADEKPWRDCGQALLDAVLLTCLAERKNEKASPRCGTEF